MRKAPVRVLRRAARPVGVVLLGLAAVMLACAAVGFVTEALGMARQGVDTGGGLDLALSALVTGLVGALLHRGGTADELSELTRGDAIVLTAGIWLGSGLFGALPYVLGAGMSPVDGVFEAISGFTTTGATVVGDIEGTLSRPLLLWRSLTQWLGGMGIVVLFVAVFPRVGAAGKHLFRAEVPGPTAGGLAPRIGETAMWLYGMYVALTVLEFVALVLLGMQPFEALCHSFTTVSTGGFSTRDASVGAFGSPAIEVTISLFMLAAGVNFGLYYGVLRSRRPSLFLQSTELRGYLALVGGVVLALTVFILGSHDGSIATSARYALFTTATFVTSTGYGTEDYMTYPGGALGLVFLLMFVGGCAGSTAGGMKVARVLLVLKTLQAQVRRSVRPHVVQVVRMGGRKVESSLLLEVSAFLCLYVASVGVFTWLVCVMEGVDLPTGFGATLTSISNMGPAPFHGGTDNFVVYSDLAKLMFSFEMVLGRLEFMTLLALLVPEVWD
jgi:trk system potassium uptake protein TrkH